MRKTVTPLSLIVPAYKRFRKTSWREWTSATSTRNYMLRDPLMDWLNLYKNKLLSRQILKTETINSFREGDSPSQYKFTPFIKSQGARFEDKLMDILKSRLGSGIIDIGAAHNSCRSEVYIEKTMDAMKKGYGVIYSGVVWNPYNKTYGVPDLLIRSDMFDRVVMVNPVPFYEKCIRAPYICADDQAYHYRVVDIKFATLNLRADGIHLLNQGSVPAFKSQLYIYNEALAIMQGYNPHKAYVLGSKWKYTCKDQVYSGKNCLSKLGTIDFKGVDAVYVNRTKKALRWLTRIKNRGSRLDPLKPGNCFEMYPNMCNGKDYPYGSLKQKIADHIKEITSIWMVGTENRKNAHKRKIYKWTDSRCDAKLLGIGGKKTVPIVNRMLEVNRDDNAPMINPANIECNLGGWNKKEGIELYVDFESVNDVITDFSTLPYSEELSMIFMIGAGYEDLESGEWIYKRFIAAQLNYESEKKMCDDFIRFARGLGRIKIFHWAAAESVLWRQATERHNLFYPGWFVDMLQVFKNEPIIIKGCLNFSVKTIARRMHELGLISTVWNERVCGRCMNGADAMIAALEASKEAARLHCILEETGPMKEIISYNEVDCKVVYEIVKYLRNNHV